MYNDNITWKIKENINPNNIEYINNSNIYLHSTWTITILRFEKYLISSARSKYDSISSKEFGMSCDILSKQVVSEAKQNCQSGMLAPQYKFTWRLTVVVGHLMPSEWMRPACFLWYVSRIAKSFTNPISIETRLQSLGTSLKIRTKSTFSYFAEKCQILSVFVYFFMLFVISLWSKIHCLDERYTRRQNETCCAIPLLRLATHVHCIFVDQICTILYVL